MTHADAARLCQRAHLAPTAIYERGRCAVIDVLPLAVTPEAVIRRLYAAGAYAVGYEWHGGQDSFVVRGKESA